MSATCLSPFSISREVVVVGRKKVEGQGRRELVVVVVVG